MLEYKLYRLDGTTRHIVSIRGVVARDDLDALAEAEKLCDASAIEVWQGTRCVARVKKDNAALDASDRTSL